MKLYEKNSSCEVGLREDRKPYKKKLQPYEIGELDQYLFGQGTHYEIFRKMGAHKAVQKKQEGVYFAVWAAACSESVRCR